MSAEIGLLERDLRQELERRRVVVVAGAGVSVAATGGQPVASWLGLLEDGISRCEQLFLTLPDTWGERLRARLRAGEVDDLLSVADEVAQALGAPTGGEYRRWLRETVGALRPTQPQVIAALHDLDVPIATTNYDSLIEEVTGLEPVTWRDDARVERLLRGDEPGVLHLHGHWEDPESIVLGIHSYEQVLGDAYAQFVPRALSTFNSLLFVGCGEGLKDPNFEAFRRWLADISSGLEYRHFRLALAGEARAVAAEHMADEKIRVVTYGERHEELAPFLRRLRPHPRPQPEVPARQGSLAWLRRHLRLVAAGAGVLTAAAVLPAVLIPGGVDGGNSKPTNIAVGYAGAGGIDKSGETDVYSFRGRGRRVTLVSQPVAGSCPSYGTITWKLMDEGSGETLFDNSMECTEPFGPLGRTLKRGAYTLTIYGEERATGLYRFALIPVVEQHFTMAVGDTVREGKPKPGAGEIAQPGELDVYSFGSKGQTVSLISQPVAGTCPSLDLYWRLIDEGSGETLVDNWMECSEPFGPLGRTLKRDVYTLTVYGQKGSTGRYRFTLLPIAEQRFAITVGDTVREGKPEQGAGEIAEPGQLDVYSFSGKGQTIRLVSQPVAGTCPSLDLYWKLVHEATGETLFDNWMECSEPFGEDGYTLKEGSYTLIVYGKKGATGRYRFSLRPF